MLFWWLTVSLSCAPIAKMLTRILISLSVATLTPPIVTTTTTATTTLSTHTTTPQDRSSPLAEGIYDYESSVNFDNYLKELGVSYVLRKLAALAYPAVTISKTCQRHNQRCLWTVRTDTIFRSHVVSFEMGEEVRDTTMDGRRVTFNVMQDSLNRWVEVQTSGDTTTTLTRDFSLPEMRVTLKVNHVTSTSIFKRRLTDEDHF